MRAARSRFIAAAFDHDQVPTIACFNKATASLGVSFDRLIAALQTFVDDYFVPVWGTPVKLLKTTTFRIGAWAMAFLDDADVAHALGYHDLTPDGLPLSKVFSRRFRREDRRGHRSTYRGKAHRMRPSRPAR